MYNILSKNRKARNGSRRENGYKQPEIDKVLREEEEAVAEFKAFSSDD